MVGGMSAMAADYPATLDGATMSMAYRADTWEIFTNLQVDRITFEPVADRPDTYQLKGFLSWLNPSYVLGYPEATYNPEEGRLYIESGQEIVTRYEYDWSLCNMADEENMNTLPIIFQLDDDGIFRQVTGGTYEGDPYCSICMVLTALQPGDPYYGTEDEIVMLYLFREPLFHPFNGSMSYAFVAQNGNEFQMECDIYYEINGNNVMMRNWSNTGFDYNVFFTIDPENHTLTATNQACLYDPDMMGECILSAASPAGSLITNGGDYYLQGTFAVETIDGETRTVASFPTWGCFDDRDRNFFVPTNDTKVYFPEDITNPTPNAVGRVDVDNESPVEYFTLDGIKVVNPQPGRIYIMRQGSTAKKVIK